MERIQAGELRHRVELQRNEAAESAQDEYGAPIPNQITYARPWCKIEPVSGREAEYAKSFAASVSHKITMRYNSTQPVKPTDLIIWGDRSFSINTVLNVEERNHSLAVFATELPA
jgi:SPP1 family predicted phage head-tail adaptor